MPVWPVIAGLPVARIAPCVSGKRTGRGRSRAQFASTATKGMHDLDPVGRVQHVVHVPAARHDFAIDLDRDPAFGQSLFVQEIVQGGAFAGPAGLAIQQDFHAD